MKTTAYQHLSKTVLAKTKHYKLYKPVFIAVLLY